MDERERRVNGATEDVRTPGVQSTPYPMAGAITVSITAYTLAPHTRFPGAKMIALAGTKRLR